MMFILFDMKENIFNKNPNLFNKLSDFCQNLLLKVEKSVDLIFLAIVNRQQYVQ